MGFGSLLSWGVVPSLHLKNLPNFQGLFTEQGPRLDLAQQDRGVPREAGSVLPLPRSFLSTCVMWVTEHWARRQSLRLSSQLCTSLCDLREGPLPRCTPFPHSDAKG